MPSYLFEKQTASNQFAIEGSDSIKPMRPLIPAGSGYNTGPMSGKPVGWMRGSPLDGSSSAVMKIRRQPAGMVKPPNVRSGVLLMMF